MVSAEDIKEFTEDQIRKLKVEEILKWSMIAYHSRARELFLMSDLRLTQLWCSLYNQDDVEKYEWRVFQDKAEYVHLILIAEFEANEHTVPKNQ